MPLSDFPPLTNDQDLGKGVISSQALKFEELSELPAIYRPAYEDIGKSPVAGAGQTTRFEYVTTIDDSNVPSLVSEGVLEGFDLRENNGDIIISQGKAVFFDPAEKLGYTIISVTTETTLDIPSDIPLDLKALCPHTVYLKYTRDVSGNKSVSAHIINDNTNLAEAEQSSYIKIGMAVFIRRVVGDTPTISSLFNTYSPVGDLRKTSTEFFNDEGIWSDRININIAIDGISFMTDGGKIFTEAALESPIIINSSANIDILKAVIAQSPTFGQLHITPFPSDQVGARRFQSYNNGLNINTDSHLLSGNMCVWLIFVTYDGKFIAVTPSQSDPYTQTISDDIYVAYRAIARERKKIDKEQNTGICLIAALIAPYTTSNKMTDYKILPLKEGLSGYLAKSSINPLIPNPASVENTEDNTYVLGVRNQVSGYELIPTITSKPFPGQPRLYTKANDKTDFYYQKSPVAAANTKGIKITEKKVIVYGSWGGEELDGQEYGLPSFDSHGIKYIQILDSIGKTSISYKSPPIGFTYYLNPPTFSVTVENGAKFINLHYPGGDVLNIEKTYRETLFRTLLPFQGPSKNHQTFISLGWRTIVGLSGNITSHPITRAGTFQTIYTAYSKEKGTIESNLTTYGNSLATQIVCSNPVQILGGTPVVTKFPLLIEDTGDDGYIILKINISSPDMLNVNTNNQLYNQIMYRAMPQEFYSSDQWYRASAGKWYDVWGDLINLPTKDMTFYQNLSESEKYAFAFLYSDGFTISSYTIEPMGSGD